MEPVWIATLVSVATFVMTASLILWRGGRNSATSTIDLNRMEARLAQTIAETARDLEERQDRLTAAFGDSVKAVREQMVLNEKETVTEIHNLSDRIRQVEIWARDEFMKVVSEEDFREVCARIEKNVADQGRTINAAMEGVREAIMKLAMSDHRDNRDHRTI